MPHRFKAFIEPILAPGFEWFGALHYPSPTRDEDDPRKLELWERLANRPITRFALEGREAIRKLYARADKAASNWAGGIMLKVGTQEFRQITVIERRPDFSVQYHFLFGGCSSWKGFDNGGYLRKWRDEHHDKAYERTLNNERIGGLLNYLVMQLDCPIKFFTPEVEGTYHRSDFYQYTGAASGT